MAKVHIKLRDLDTDEQVIQVVEVDRVPDNALRQEQQLAELVAGVEPAAREKSFADGVASFVGPKHLIVAWFAIEPAIEHDRRDANDDDAADPQDQLFAA